MRLNERAVERDDLRGAVRRRFVVVCSAVTWHFTSFSSTADSATFPPSGATRGPGDARTIYVSDFATPENIPIVFDIVPYISAPSGECGLSRDYSAVRTVAPVCRRNVRVPITNIQSMIAISPKRIGCVTLPTTSEYCGARKYVRQIAT